MSLLDRLRSLVEDPPPVYAFELSRSGVAWVVRAAKGNPELQFRAFPQATLDVSPVRDNVLDAEGFAAHVKGLFSLNGHRKDAALILPDYCSRIAVLDFESFPKDKDEQTALVRFRLKKTVPFDMDAAAVSFHVQKSSAKRVEVLAVTAAYEIIAKYEAPFRAAGLTPGLCTSSTLAVMDLMPASGMNLLAKRCDNTLTVAICDGRQPKLVRCVELAGESIPEAMSVIFPTIAYAEDELKRHPERVLSCGFGVNSEEFQRACASELSLNAEPLRSAWGLAQEHNAGLLGWVQAQEGNA
ncbi:MAG: hypothetical protein U0Q16_20360 [Bryobacteraceae bacterium]